MLSKCELYSLVFLVDVIYCITWFDLQHYNSSVHAFTFYLIKMFDKKELVTGPLHADLIWCRQMYLGDYVFFLCVCLDFWLHFGQQGALWDSNWDLRHKGCGNKIHPSLPQHDYFDSFLFFWPVVLSKCYLLATVSGSYHNSSMV